MEMLEVVIFKCLPPFLSPPPNPLTGIRGSICQILQERERLILSCKLTVMIEKGN